MWRRRDFSDQGGDRATFQIKAETARLSRLRRRRRNFPEQGGDGAIFQTKAETARLSRLKRRRRNFPDQGEDGATFQNNAETAQFFKPRRRRRDFPHKAEMARLSRTMRRRRDQKSIPRNQGGDGATFQNNPETARPKINSSRPKRRRCDFPDHGADRATSQTKAETPQLSRLRRKHRYLRKKRRQRIFNFSDHDG